MKISKDIKRTVSWVCIVAVLYLGAYILHQLWHPSLEEKIVTMAFIGAAYISWLAIHLEKVIIGHMNLIEERLEEIERKIRE